MFNNTEQSLAAEFFPIGEGYRSIESYRDRLLSLYTEPGMQHLEFDHWTVAEIRTYNNKNTRVKHEYLIVTLTDGGEGKVHLRIDRRMHQSFATSFLKRMTRKANSLTNNNDDDEQRVTQAEERKPQRFLIKATAEVSLCPNHRLEKDTNREFPVKHIAFREDHRISLPKFVSLVFAINGCSSAHRLGIIQNNCYLFCFAVTEALKARYEHDVVPALGSNRQGMWYTLPADKLYCDANIADFLVNADKLWDEFTEQIDSIIGGPGVERRKRHGEDAEGRGAELEETIGSQAE